MRAASWRLWRGDILLGTLHPERTNQPFFYFSFVPTPAFESVRPLFDDELRLAEADDADGDLVEAAYDRIRNLGLHLESIGRGSTIHEFLLHIRDDEAWFRY